MAFFHQDMLGQVLSQARISVEDTVFRKVIQFLGSINRRDFSAPHRIYDQPFLFFFCCFFSFFLMGLEAKGCELYG